MQQYQFIGDPLPGYPDEYAVCRILTADEVQERVMALMLPDQRLCLAANLAVVRGSSGGVRLAA